MNDLIFVLATGVALMAPVLWASLGELVSEKAGTLNLGIEGVMILGAFGAAAGYQRTGSFLIGVVAAVGLGLVSGLLLTVLYVILGTDQVVTGILFSMVAFGAAIVTADAFVASPRSASLMPVPIPILADIPWIGPILFDQNVLVYGAMLAVPVVAFVLYRTWFGLTVRAAGERPLVIETAGLSVRRTRAIALTFSCVMTAVGGATLTLSTSSIFQSGTTAGRGYLALVVVVLARWNPWGVALGALLFGCAQALQFQAERIPLLSNVPYQFLLMVPYVIAIAAVVIFRGSHYPAAVGRPYRPTHAS